MSVVRKIAGVFRRDPLAARAGQLYALAVERARDPVFYANLAVPDTADGRFEMIGLHVHLLCRRLAAGGASGGALAQALFDGMFADFDRNLREMGVGDLAVGKRIKRMAQDYFGRAGAVEAGLQGGVQNERANLADALRRNVYADTTVTEGQVGALAHYIEDASAHLDGVPLDQLPDTALLLFGAAPSAAA